MNLRPRFWFFLLAALLPGGCSLSFAPAFFGDLFTDGFGQHALLQLRFLASPWGLLQILGYVSAVFFGWLVIARLRGREPELYRNNLLFLLGGAAIFGALGFLLYYFTYLRQVLAHLT